MIYMTLNACTEFLKLNKPLVAFATYLKQENTIENVCGNTEVYVKF